MKKAGITPQMMGLHLAFVFEYAFTKVCTGVLGFVHVVCVCDRPLVDGLMDRPAD